MRTGDDKRQLKHSLKIEVSRRSLGDPDVIIVDISALMSHLQWPKNGTLSDLSNAVLHWLIPLLEKSHVHLVCDRYF